MVDANDIGTNFCWICGEILNSDGTCPDHNCPNHED